MQNNKILSAPSKIQTGFYKKTTRCFFFQSKLFEAQITELFDELWPLVTAVKNLRKQVWNYYQKNNVKQNHDLTSYFVDSEDKTNRPNLYRACIEQSWEQQEYSISRNLLTNIFALYEGWIETLLPLLGSNNGKAKDFQFPNKVRIALASMQQHRDDVLVDAMYDVYVTNNSDSKLYNLENYLKVYRYFKECRNCIIHSGGKTNQNLVDAYNDVRTLTVNDLDVNEIPQMEVVSRVDEFVKIGLRGVVGFSQIIIKLVRVLDIEFIKTEKALDCFVNQIKEFTPKTEYLYLDKHKIKEKSDSIMSRSGFLIPRYSDAFYKLLNDKHILK